MISQSLSQTLKVTSKIYPMRYAMAGLFGPYLLFGFIFELEGTVVAHSSGAWFKMAVLLVQLKFCPNSATTLFVGGFILLAGLLLLLVGFFQAHINIQYSVTKH